VTAAIPSPLPGLLVLTDRHATGGRPLLDVVRAAVDGGARAVVLREKDLTVDDRRRLADQLRAVVPLLIVASDRDPLPVDAPDAVHLSSRAAWPAAATRGPLVVGRSCHDAASLTAAATEGCAYATLSPIHVTATKPGYGPALGVDALRNAPLPVYALGGVEPHLAADAIAAGATGVAVLGAVMRADHPDRVVAALLAALGRFAPLPTPFVAPGGSPR
jgi:thiamine-phosphate pyrophosphorylase